MAGTDFNFDQMMQAIRGEQYRAGKLIGDSKKKPAKRERKTVSEGKSISRGEKVGGGPVGRNTDGAARVNSLMNRVKQAKKSGKLTDAQIRKARESAQKRDNQKARTTIDGIYHENYSSPESYDIWQEAGWGNRRKNK